MARTVRVLAKRTTMRFLKVWSWVLLLSVGLLGLAGGCKWPWDRIRTLYGVPASTYQAVQDIKN